MSTKKGVCRICGTTKDYKNNFMASGTNCTTCYKNKYENKRSKSLWKKK